jgi:membrane protein required for colicin V production
MLNFLENLVTDINLLDIIFLIILVYSIIQCFLKGFSLSLISFMKWVLSALITIILTPKFKPIVSDYIQSEFITDDMLGFSGFYPKFVKKYANLNSIIAKATKK